VSLYECHYTECLYTERHCTECSSADSCLAECRFAECYYVQCHNTDCRGALYGRIFQPYLLKLISWNGGNEVLTQPLSPTTYVKREPIIDKL